MSYSVTKNENNTFDITEKDTNTTIFMKTNEKHARNYCRKLNLGSGFNGFTPLFFADIERKQLKNMQKEAA